ncbi:MAG: hypothetical protein DMF19_10625 [Verrucomicrobia bacterium]|nr:MAG: hypothetical protein DMF19_10625 [Verrucomicrobiota bacterium]
MELLEAEKTAQPQQQDPKDDLFDHRRTQVATIGPKPRGRRRWLWLKDENRRSEPGKREAFSYQRQRRDAASYWFSVISYWKILSFKFKRFRFLASVQQPRNYGVTCRVQEKAKSLEQGANA